jgi:hypothetical protein
MNNTDANNHIQPLDRVAPAPDVVARRMGEEMVLINMRTNKIYRLNHTGARFFELLSLSPTRDLGEIKSQLAGEFGVTEESVRGEMTSLLRRLGVEGLVQFGARD